MKEILFAFALALMICHTAVSQNSILSPGIINYTKQSYEAGNQNRCIGQDKRGILYFANDDGLLVFDRTYWKTYTLPGKGIVRSLVVSEDKIYVGGQQEIGYFFFDKMGGLSYRSLKPLIPAGENDFADVWHIVRSGKDIFFQSNKRIFRFHNDKITAFKSVNWSFLGSNGGVLIAQQYENGLVLFRDGLWLPLKTDVSFVHSDLQVRSISAFGKNNTLLTTLKSGFFILNEKGINKFETPALTGIASKIIYSSCMIDPELTAIATKLDGYYIINGRGEIVQHLSTQQGLQTNNIISVFADRKKNIWLGMDNGIDLVLHDNAIKHINPDRENKSPGYAAITFKNKLYIGTALGLYALPLQSSTNLESVPGDFNLVKNSNGIVWGLSIVNDQLLMGNNDGAFIIKENKAFRLDSSTGFWSFQPLSLQQPAPVMVAGTYNGLNFYSYAAGRFVNKGVHTHFESAKYITILDGDIWVTHPYQGLYKVYLDKDGKPFNEPYIDKRHILSSGHNHLFKIRNKIILATSKGIFEYDKKTADFNESAFFKQIFGKASASYLTEDARGNIWFIQDKKAGVIDMTEPGKPVIVYFSELNNIVLGNDEEFIYPINNSNILVAGEEGFYHINYEKYKKSQEAVSVLIRSVTAFNQKDSTLFGGYLGESDTAVKNDRYTISHPLGYKWNSLHFEFSSPLYGRTSEYSSRLKGYEKAWSGWSKKAEKSYTNLSAGDYVFEVITRDNKGNQSPVSFVKFSILPP